MRSLSMAYAGTDLTLTEHSLKRIADLKNLHTLDISSIAAVSNAVLTEIASGCKELRDILVRSCTYLGDDGVCSLAQLSHLEHADLSGCLLVTTKAIQTLLNAFPIQPDNTSVKEKSRQHTVTVVVGGTICDVGSLRTRKSRMVVDQSDYSSLSSSTARDLLVRSFIIDALNAEEDDSPMDNDRSIAEWAEREARELGLIIK
ncbi:unnamed protein product [Toxocara canis]|uniref:RNI-like protein n=1 Tax=Toxocara canis TaxID=6265 RepID=A0A3P7GHQ7_TOXCA|nr:unnamed protein product [Toxocara canis]